MRNLFIQLFIVWRYIRGKKGALFSLNAKLAFFGVFTGTSLLVVVLSIFNGFQEQVISSIFRFDPHLLVEKSGGEKIENWQEHADKIREALGDKAAKVGAMIQSAALLRVSPEIDHIFVRGVEFDSVDGTNRVRPPDDFPKIEAVDGQEAADYRNGNIVFIGREMAYNFHLSVNDTIEIIAPKGQFNARLGVTPSIAKFTIAGFFSTGHYQYDSRVVIMPLPVAQRLFQTGSATQQIYVKLHDLADLSYARRTLWQELPFFFTVRTIEDEQRNFFSALKLEKTIMVTIVFLFIIAAMVGIVVATHNIVRSRKKDIGILKALGISDTAVLSIFTAAGFVTGVAGTVAGLIMGVFLALNLENILNSVELAINTLGDFLNHGEWIAIELIPRDVYYFDHLPVSVDIPFLHLLGTVAILLSGIASLIPAWYAGRTQPIEIIRGAEL